MNRLEYYIHRIDNLVTSDTIKREDERVLSEVAELLQRWGHLEPGSNWLLKNYPFMGGLWSESCNILCATHYPNEWLYTVELDSGRIFENVPVRYLIPIGAEE